MTTECMRRYSKFKLAKDSATITEDTRDRPRNYGDCVDAGLGTPEMPCPYVGCKYNLYLDVSEDAGSIRYNFPDKDPSDLTDTCALRVAETTDGASLQDCGDIIGITREGVRQIEKRALVKIRGSKDGRQIVLDGC